MWILSRYSEDKQVMNDTTVLEAQKLGKYFHEPKEFRVLDNISMVIQEGEFVTIQGKSGSGKSTLLYLLSTMDTEYDGELFLDGDKLTGQSKNSLATIRNEKIGFIFQFHYLLPEFTALKNIMLPALKAGRWSRKETKQRAQQKLEMLGITDQALKPASKLSGGQQQRVAIARALINEPKIIMCDEPTGNLDSRNTSIVFDIFKQITTESGQTVVAVTHDDDFANASDRIIRMQDGRLISG
jgi:lipoprotein-releasing system ATP-binding protein